MKMEGNIRDAKEWILGEETKESVILCGTITF